MHAPRNYFPHFKNVPVKFGNTYIVNLPPPTGVVADLRPEVGKAVVLLREILAQHSLPGDKVLEMAAGGAPGALAGIYEGRHVYSFDSDAELKEPVLAKLEVTKVDYAKGVVNGSHQKRPQSAAEGHTAVKGKSKVAKVQLHFG